MIVGGVDLLAKAEEQEKLLEESNNELEERRRRADQLRRELEEKEVKQFATLQFSTKNKSKSLVKLSSCLHLFCSGLFCDAQYVCVPVMYYNSKNVWT